MLACPTNSSFNGPMSEPVRPKITFGEMRASGVRDLLIYCSDFRCSHWTAISADRWPDDVRLSDIEPRFTCQACGTKGADVRPNFHWGTKAAPPDAGLEIGVVEAHDAATDGPFRAIRGVVGFTPTC
jgi:hypothetical protein